MQRHACKNNTEGGGLRQKSASISPEVANRLASSTSFPLRTTSQIDITTAKKNTATI